jgi:hypothetical protein
MVKISCRHIITFFNVADLSRVIYAVAAISLQYIVWQLLILINIMCVCVLFMIVTFLGLFANRSFLHVSQQ